MSDQFDFVEQELADPESLAPMPVYHNLPTHLMQKYLDILPTEVPELLTVKRVGGIQAHDDNYTVCEENIDEKTHLMWSDDNYTVCEENVDDEWVVISGLMYPVTCEVCRNSVHDFIWPKAEA